MNQTVYDFFDIFADSDTQEFALYDLKTNKEVFRGTRDGLPGDYQDLEIQSVDNLTEPTKVLTLNVEVE
jgi:hypothetical protein